MKIKIIILTLAILGKITAQQIAVISNNIVTIDNGIVNAVIEGGKMISLNLKDQPNLLNNGGFAYFSIVDNVGYYSPTSLMPQVKINTSEIADIFFNIIQNFYLEMHYVFKKNESGFYTYFIVKDVGLADRTLNQLRFAVRVDKDIFDYAWTVEREGAMLYPDTLANFVEEVQDATFLLQDGSIYTKYDWCNYKIYDLLHGVLGNGYGIWNIEASHEYINGGPTMQETTLHSTNTTPILLCPFYSQHFGGVEITPKDEYKNWIKIFGPAFTYINTGLNEDLIADAKIKAHDLKDQWPYKWLHSDLFPVVRGSLSGILKMQGHGETDSAMVLLCKSGPSWLLNDDHWQKQPYDYFFWAEVDNEGRFNIEKIRPGTYTLYAYTQKGKLIDELRIDSIVIDTGKNSIDTVIWNANDLQKTMFQIGIADHKSGEYKLADLPRAYGRWKECPLTLTYNTNTDNPRENWYYCQKEQSYWDIKFNINDLSAIINPRIKVALSGSDAKPHLDLILNGITVSANDLGTDSGIRRSSLTSGKFTMITCDVDKKLLTEGKNILTLKCYGSEVEYKGIMYDAILFESDTSNQSVSIKKDNTGNKNKINIFPNPATILNIQSESEISSLQITDLSGKMVIIRDNISTNHVGINISDFPAGIYFITIISGENRIVKKIFISSDS